MSNLEDNPTNESLDQDKALIEELWSLLASFSSEFRTPLTSISGYAHLLISGHFGPLNDEQLGAVEVIMGTVGRANAMHGLCMDEINLINFVYTHDKLNFDKIEIQVWFQEIIKQYGTIAKTKNQKFMINVSESHYAKSNRHQGAKMIGYLIDNACKYSGEGEQIIITSQARSDDIFVTITDNGIGISEGEQQHIFDEWYRGKHEYVYQQEGFGRGLYNAKRLAGVLGCEIGVKSEVGKGSTFWFTLPLADDEEEE
jgi:two-component system sensor histidine kinase VicK